MVSLPLTYEIGLCRVMIAMSRSCFSVINFYFFFPSLCGSLILPDSEISAFLLFTYC